MSQRLALVIGNSIYRDPALSGLTTPGADVGALADILLSPEIGGFDDVKLLVNTSSATLRRSISSFFSQKTREDLLLLYFSGHGVLDDQGRLYLAAKDTEKDLLGGTAIPATFITDEMNRSRSNRQVLILDCCHSGAFSRGAKGSIGASVGTAAAFEGTGTGRVVLTATDATQFAWEGDQVIGQVENSLFTHYMVKGLQTGEADADGDGKITIDELYDYVYSHIIQQTTWQTPGKWSYKEQGEIIIAQSARPSGARKTTLIIPEPEDELIQKLGKRYTQGLSAYWLEEWDDAIQCFQSIVDIQPDYQDAVEKLNQSRNMQRLHRFYEQARERLSEKNWGKAVEALELLITESPNFKDASKLLKEARQQLHLDSLYAEARQLAQAEKWQAVRRVFVQITAIEPDYPDPENLLPNAETALASIERQTKLHDLYRRALEEMNQGNWTDAQTLLVELAEVEPGYAETRRLLQRVETEISNAISRKELETRIILLYEQASKFVSDRQWQKALEKIQEIQQLDPEFPDAEALGNKARMEMEREEQETSHQKKLTKLYNAAVQLVETNEYQKALETWREIRAIDPHYPDRQKVQRIAQKKLKALASQARPAEHTPNKFIIFLKKNWIIQCILAVVVVLTLVFHEPIATLLQSAQSIPGTNTSVPGNIFAGNSSRTSRIRIRVSTSSNWVLVKLPVDTDNITDYQIIQTEGDPKQALLTKNKIYLTQTDKASIDHEISVTLDVSMKIPQEEYMVFEIQSGNTNSTLVEIYNLNGPVPAFEKRQTAYFKEDNLSSEFSIKTQKLLSEPDYSNVQEISIDFGVENQEYGLEQVLSENADSDGRTNFVTTRGKEARIAAPNDAQERYFYLQVDPRFTQFTSEKRMVIQFEYLDLGNCQILLQYDSTDFGLEDAGAYKPAYDFIPTNTNQWQTKYFIVPDPNFNQRQYGVADFRIFVGNCAFVINRVAVTVH